MNYIWCGGYGGIMLLLYIKNVKNELVTGITWQHDAVKFFNAENIPYIYFDFDKDVQQNRFSHCLFKYHKLKLLLDNIIHKMNFGVNDCYIMSSKWKGYPDKYFAKELSKLNTGKVFYRNVADKELPIYGENFIRDDKEIAKYNVAYKCCLFTEVKK